MAKYTNLIVGTGLILTVIASFVTLSVFNPFAFTMTCYEGFFGLLIMMSSCNLKLIKDNFLFLMTGLGKGLFNIFVGTLLCFLTSNTSVVQYVCGYAMITAGLIFLFLSCVKNVSDEEL